MRGREPRKEFGNVVSEIARLPRRRRGDTERIWEAILDRFSGEPGIDLAYPTTRFFNHSTEGQSPLPNATGAGSAVVVGASVAQPNDRLSAESPSARRSECFFMSPPAALALSQGALRLRRPERERTRANRDQWR